MITKAELARLKELAEKATDVCEAATFFASPSDGFDFDTREVVEFAEQVIDSVPSILSLVHPLIEAVEKMDKALRFYQGMPFVAYYALKKVWGEEE